TGARGLLLLPSQLKRKAAGLVVKAGFEGRERDVAARRPAITAELAETFPPRLHIAGARRRIERMRPGARRGGGAARPDRACAQQNENRGREPAAPPKKLHGNPPAETAQEYPRHARLQGAYSNDARMLRACARQPARATSGADAGAVRSGS